MTKREFEEFIDRCDGLLWRDSGMGMYRVYTGYLCNAFNKHNSTVCPVFKETFRGARDDRSLGMFGDSAVLENQTTRHVALRLFEEYCISEKLYKGLQND